MATDDEVEAAVMSLVDHAPVRFGGSKFPSVSLSRAGGIDMWRGVMRAALDAAAAVRAEPGGWQPIEGAQEGDKADLWCEPPGLSAGPGRTPDCWFSSGKWWHHADLAPDGYEQVHNAVYRHPIPADPIPDSDTAPLTGGPSPGRKRNR